MRYFLAIISPPLLVLAVLTLALRVSECSNPSTQRPTSELKQNYGE